MQDTYHRARVFREACGVRPPSTSTRTETGTISLVDSRIVFNHLSYSSSYSDIIRKQHL